MSKDTKLILAILSVFFTFPAAGLLFDKNHYLAGFIYLTQIPLGIQIIRGWYNNKNFDN
jgi:hypothetical protein